MLSEQRLRYTGAGGDADYEFNYTYDRASNINKIVTKPKNQTAITTNYTYDQLGQLTKATLGDGTYDYTYSYDDYNNITSQQKLTPGTSTKNSESTYAYHNQKLDQLTTFTKADYLIDGVTKTGEMTRNYTYDAIGNPTSINQVDTNLLIDVKAETPYTLEWQRGRQLKRLQIGTDVDNKLYYNENDELVKKVKKDGSSINYYYSDGLLEYEEHLNTGGNLTRVLKYFYDGSDRPLYLLSKTDNFGKNSNLYNLYAYMYNGTGDVTALIRIRTQSGNGMTETNVVAAEYTYSPYGEIVAITGPDEIKDINPIRYKGYYYDTDMGWYNLKTRYYDPMVGRFINADDVSLLTESLEDLTDKNLYAYCDNNPINRSDDGGEIWNFVVGFAVGAAIEIGSQLLSGKKLSQISLKKVAFAGAIGAVGGVAGKVVSKLAFKGVQKAAQTFKAAKHWDKGTFRTKFGAMNYHWKKHVKNAGIKGVSRSQYTKDALKFAKRNARYLKYTRPNKAWHRPGWKGRYTKGSNGWFTSSGKIITFWYK